jgi:phosphate starvation-inducible PhoH-like protein
MKARKRTAKSGNAKTTAPVVEKTVMEDDSVESVHVKIRKLNIKFRNENQEKYFNMMSNKDITICCGPAGTGKSHLMVLKALDLFANEQDKYTKIIIIKPAVEAGESIGFLPGTMEEKLAPYTFSTLYLFKKILGDVKVERLIAKKRIDVMALGYLRGINLDSCIVVCEEAQNMTQLQMKTLLTRIGENCKMFISGDKEQIDKNFGRGQMNGLEYAMNKLKDLVEIGIFEFGPNDIVRNPIISKILERFNKN